MMPRAEWPLVFTLIPESSLLGRLRARIVRFFERPRVTCSNCAYAYSFEQAKTLPIVSVGMGETTSTFWTISYACRCGGSITFKKVKDKCRS